MLKDNHICKVQSQNFALMQEMYLKQEINKKPCSLYMTLREMLVANPNMCKLFADEVYVCFKGKRWCDEEDYSLRYEELATYGVLLSNLVYVYDFAKGTMELHTTSMGVLRTLVQSGLLKSKKEPLDIELEKIEKTLYQSDRIKRSIRAGKKLITVRLNVDIKDGGIKMTATVPRTAITLDTHAILPFTSVTKAHELLYTVFQKSICRVTMGDKVRDVTLNESVLLNIYGEVRTKKLVSYIPNIYALRFYVPSVGASKYLPGVTNIKIHEIDAIAPVSLADIDLSEVNLNYDLVIPYFRQVVSDMNREELQDAGEVFGVLCLNAEDEVIRNELYRIPTEMYGSDIWEYMKMKPSLFKVDGFKNYTSPFGSMQEVVEIPKTPQQLQKMLETGIYKILITKRNGAFSTIICTNNNRLLNRVYEKNHAGNRLQYESDGVKLKALKYYLTQVGHKDDAEVSKTVKMFCCDDLVAGSYEGVLRDIETHLKSIEYDKTVVAQPKLVTARNCNAVDKHSYYKYIDVKQIVEITKLDEITTE